MWQKVGAAHGPVIRLMLMSAMIAGSVLSGSAQYDLGASLGAYRYSITPRSSDGHGYVSTSNIPAAAFTTSLFYRERYASHVNFGFELQFTRKSFDVRYGNGSPAGSAGFNGHMDLDLLHLGLLLDVKMSPNGNSVVRFGPQLGLLVGGRKTGRTWSSYPFNSHSEELVGDAPTNFGGDIRFLFGFGFRSGSSKLAMTIDPYASMALTSIVFEDPGVRGTEVGVKVGFALGKKGTALTQWIGRIATERPTHGNW